MTSCEDEDDGICWHNHTILHVREEPCESNFVCTYPGGSDVCGDYGVAVGVRLGLRDLDLSTCIM